MFFGLGGDTGAVLPPQAPPPEFKNDTKYIIS